MRRHLSWILEKVDSDMKRWKEENFLVSGKNGALNQERTCFACDKGKQREVGVMGNLSGRLGLGQSVKDLECWAEDQNFALWAADDH